jgi:hypothetical protein
MTYQEHGHQGIWSISIAVVELSSCIEVPDTVDEGLDVLFFCGLRGDNAMLFGRPVDGTVIEHDHLQ